MSQKQQQASYVVPLTTQKILSKLGLWKVDAPRPGSGATKVSAPSTLPPAAVLVFLDRAARQLLTEGTEMGARSSPASILAELLDPCRMGPRYTVVLWFRNDPMTLQIAPLSSEEDKPLVAPWLPVPSDATELSNRNVRRSRWFRSMELVHRLQTLVNRDGRSGTGRQGGNLRILVGGGGAGPVSISIVRRHLASLAWNKQTLPSVVDRFDALTLPIFLVRLRGDGDDRFRGVCGGGFDGIVTIPERPVDANGAGNHICHLLTAARPNVNIGRGMEPSASFQSWNWTQQPQQPPRTTVWHVPRSYDWLVAFSQLDSTVEKYWEALTDDGGKSDDTHVQYDSSALSSSDDNDGDGEELGEPRGAGIVPKSRVTLDAERLDRNRRSRYRARDSQFVVVLDHNATIRILTAAANLSNAHGYNPIARIFAKHRVFVCAWLNGHPETVLGSDFCSLLWGSTFAAGGSLSQRGIEQDIPSWFASPSAKRPRGRPATKERPNGSETCWSGRNDFVRAWFHGRTSMTKGGGRVRRYLRDVYGTSMWRLPMVRMYTLGDESARAEDFDFGVTLLDSVLNREIEYEQLVKTSGGMMGGTVSAASNCPLVEAIDDALITIQLAWTSTERIVQQQTSNLLGAIVDQWNDDFAGDGINFDETHQPGTIPLPAVVSPLTTSTPKHGNPDTLARKERRIARQRAAAIGLQTRRLRKQQRTNVLRALHDQMSTGVLSVV